MIIKVYGESYLKILIPIYDFKSLRRLGIQEIFSQPHKKATLETLQPTSYILLKELMLLPCQRTVLRYLNLLPLYDIILNVLSSLIDKKKKTLKFKKVSSSLFPVDRFTYIKILSNLLQYYWKKITSLAQSQDKSYIKLNCISIYQQQSGSDC